MFFAIGAFPTVIMMGGVVDYSVALKEKAKIQSGLDGGALAAASALKKSAAYLTDAQVKAKIQKYLDINLADTGVTSKSLSIIRNGTAITAKLQAEAPTTFLGLIGIKKMQFKVVSKVEFNFPPLEVALVLDNTGSMDFYGNGSHSCGGSDFCKDNTRMAKLKEAARQFVIDLKAKVVDDPQSLKIGIVPYSTYVRLKKSYKNASWLDKSKARKCTKWTWDSDLGDYVCSDDKFFWQGIVGFRTNMRNEQDGAYSLEKIPAINYDTAPHSQRLAWAGDYNLVPKNLAKMLPLQPLTDAGRDKLLNRINQMQPDGGTYIPGGLIWGARMLSHQKPLDEGMTYDDQNTKKTRKVIVLMTDGINTCSPMAGNENYIDCNSGSNVDQAGLDSMERICNSLKQTNPDTGMPYADIMTIGFDLSELPATAKDQVEEKLRNCATLGYFPATSDDIADVFGKVGMKLSQLHISQ